jgi:precorrin-6B methylase 2
MKPEDLLSLARGFMESRILLSGAELDLFTLLAPGPLTAEEVWQRVGARTRTPRAITTLLDALAALGLLDKQQDRYRTAADAAPLVADAPGSVLPMVLHAAGLWHTWNELTSIVRETGAPAQPSSERRGPQDLQAFIGAMHAVGRPVAARIAAAVDPGPARALLDVGGATGTYSEAFLAASPALRATIFDLPPVIELARARLQQTGLLDRVTLVAGDYHEDPLPAGHDLALLSAVIHSNSPEQNLALYRKVFDALVPGGRIVIRDHVMEATRTRPRAGAIFAINMLVGTAGGGTYTSDEIRGGLEQAGFSRVRLLQHGEHMDGLVEGFRP